MASPGPPWVISQIRSKLLNVQIDDSSTVTIMTLRRPGSVMCTKRCHGEAPSTIAASWRLLSMALSPARNVTAKNGMPFQTLTRMTAGIARSGSDSHSAGQLSTSPIPASTGPIPDSVSTRLTLPKIGSNNDRQVKAVTTVGTTHGSRITPARTARPRRMWCSISAAMRPRVTLKISAYAVKTNEFSTPLWNTPSSTRAV